MCLGCFSCSCMRPRYKRLVDNIFPAIPQDGLVKSNMEKLIFFSLSSPEKLDRIGEYLYQKAGRDLSRKKIGLVIIAMEAMDQLLMACHAQTLNLFVESFLRMVQKLLESSEPDLQVLATQSFVNFANIEEDTPSYHIRYDFFVSKFSSMCHSNHPDPVTRQMIRTAGIKGLQGVIRKTVADDLIENIWEPVHMDKIIPSLLYNMQEAKIESYNTSSSTTVPDGQTDPAVLADQCIRELVGRASFNHVRSLVRPVLRHFDLHGLWVPNHFAVHVFQVIMHSIQSQYSFAVVGSLMSHLDDNKESSDKIRTSIVHVLSKIISISAEESVGPSVLEIINSLLGHVKISVVRSAYEREETQYCEALINCLGEFAAHLPDFQKVEIMVFIISKVPQSSEENFLLQKMLLKSLLTVGRRYTNVAMNTTFPISLLEPLLRLCLSGGVEMCLLVQGILHTLIDRHGNAEKLGRPSLDIQGLELVVGQCSTSDIIFMRKYSDDIYSCLVDSLSLKSNTVQCIEAVYTTLALLGVELINSETVASYTCMIYTIQELAMEPENDLSHFQRFNLHCLVVCLLSLVANLLEITTLRDYLKRVVTERQLHGSHLLPELLSHYDANLAPFPDEKFLVSRESLIDALEKSGVDTKNVTTTTRVLTAHRHSWVDTSKFRSSFSDMNSSDLDSNESTPRLSRKFPEEELTFEAMKRVLAESSDAIRERERAKQQEIFKTFRKMDFHDIVLQSTNEDSLSTKLTEILNRSGHVTSPHPQVPNPAPPPIYEALFPELFAY